MAFEFPEHKFKNNKFAASWNKCHLGPTKCCRHRGKRVDCVSYNISTPYNASVGYKIFFISDLHLSGNFNEKAIISEIIDYLYAFKPDILLLGGDMISFIVKMHILEDFLEQLSKYKCIKLAVLGNWERNKRWLDLSYWDALYERYGINLLVNDYCISDVISIWGLDDISSAKRTAPLEWTGGEHFKLILAHSPDSIIWQCGTNVSKLPNLAIAGHTHGGQIRLPYIGALYSSSVYGREFDYGLYQNSLSSSQMLISAGLGHQTFPFRLNCRREVVAITLT